MTDDVRKTTQKHTPITLARAVDLFLLDRKARNLADRTLAFYEDRLRPFLSWLETSEHVTDLRDLGPAHVRAYLLALRERGMGAYGQHAIARTLRAFLNYCVLDGLLDVSPMRQVRMPKLPQEILPAFDAADVNALLEACADSTQPERDRAVVLALLDTGCRAREFLALDIANVDLKTGEVIVRLGKGAKDRRTGLGVRARKAAMRYLATRQDAGADAPLWVTQEGTRLRAEGLRGILNRLAARADVAHVHPHTFRRTAAVTMFRSGASLVQIAQLLGHSNLEVLGAISRSMRGMHGPHTKRMGRLTSC